MGLIQVHLLINDRVYQIMRADANNNKLVWHDTAEQWQQYYRERFGIEVESVPNSVIGSVWMTEENYTLYLLRWS